MSPPLLERALDWAEGRLNLSVMPASEAEDLREGASQLHAFREEASELAWHSLDYFSGRPQEWRPERRKRLAQRSRIALQGDPLAGAEADHYANFGLGRGISLPVAKSQRVQQIIDRSWTDHNNEEKLTGYDAQRAISNELKAGANVYPLAFIRGGRVRVAFLNADTVDHVITDPDDRQRVLWYRSYKEPKQRWLWDEDRFELDQSLDPNTGMPKYVYYPHWRNLEEARRERRDAGVDEGSWPAELRDPPPEKKGEGLVYHARVNRLLEQVFGVPPWARTLRFYSAMNRFTEARVAMAQASASFIAKRVMRGGPKSITQAATAILQQTGEIGARYSAEEGRVDIAPAGARPPGAASLFNENESHRLESLSLNSGAANAAQDGQIIRGAAIAPSALGQHMFGATGVDLSDASSLELPAMMAIQAWQETLEQLYRWFTNLSIEAAVRAGELGGSFPGGGPFAELPTEELSLFEADQLQEAQGRTGEDLTYSFQMPYPGRRNLPDVTNTFTAVLQAVDKEGENEPLVRLMLDFLLRHGVEAEDPAGAVDLIWARQEELIEERKKEEKEQREFDRSVQKEKARTRAVTRDPRPAGARSAQAHARTRGASADPKRQKALAADDDAWWDGPDLEEELWLPEDLREPTQDFSSEVAGLFREAVTVPSVTAAGAVALPSTNGRNAPAASPTDDPRSGG